MKLTTDVPRQQSAKRNVTWTMMAHDLPWLAGQHLTCHLQCSCNVSHSSTHYCTLVGCTCLMANTAL